MMNVIYGTDRAPLVLRVGGSHYNTALSGYVNDSRTCGAYLIVERTKGAKSLTLSDAQCILKMMKNICGINSAPLVLRNGGSHYNTALSGYVNDNRTSGAYFIVESTKGAKSLTLCKAQGLKKLNQSSTDGAKSITLGEAQGILTRI